MLQSLKVIFRHEQLLMPEVYTVHYMHVAIITITQVAYPTIICPITTHYYSITTVYKERCAHLNNLSLFETLRLNMLIIYQ